MGSRLSSSKAMSIFFETSPSLSFWKIPMMRFLLTVYTVDSLGYNGKKVPVKEHPTDFHLT